MDGLKGKVICCLSNDSYDVIYNYLISHFMGLGLRVVFLITKRDRYMIRSVWHSVGLVVDDFIKDSRDYKTIIDSCDLVIGNDKTEWGLSYARSKGKEVIEVADLPEGEILTLFNNLVEGYDELC